MSKRKRNVSRKTLGRRYQSDFINVSMRPRALIIDPICDRCRGRMPKVLNCGRCKGTGKDPEGDKWFDNQDRVKSTIGPKHQKGIPVYSTWVTKRWNPEMYRKFQAVVRYEERRTLPDIMETVLEGFQKRLEVEFKGGWESVARRIPPTVGIGAVIETNDGHLELAATSAVKYTWDNLPRRKAMENSEREGYAVKEFKQLSTQSPRIQVMNHFDKFVTIRRTEDSWLRMFFAGDKYIFEEIFATHSRRSMVYTGAEYAKNKARNPDKIDWLVVSKRPKEAEEKLPSLNMERKPIRSDE